MSDITKNIAGAESAPIIHFEIAPLSGVASDGTCKIALVATYQDFVAGKAESVPVVFAHLRGSPGAFAALRNAINDIEVALSKPEGQAH